LGHRGGVGKHVVIETPPALSARDLRKLKAAAIKRGKQVIFAFQRRFGGPEMAATQAVAKGYAGNTYHVRATWTRTRGIPIGTGWYTNRARSGGGALLDLGIHLIDLGVLLLGNQTPVSAYAIAQKKFSSLVPNTSTFDVEDAGTAVVQFEGNKTLELSCAWAVNQPPAANGTSCRVIGEGGALDVYTQKGPILYRGFNAKGEAKTTELKQPRVAGHAALFRHFRECMLGKGTPETGIDHSIAMMEIIEAIYKSIETGKTEAIKRSADKQLAPVEPMPDDSAAVAIADHP